MTVSLTRQILSFHQKKTQFQGHFQGKITVKMVTCNMEKTFDSEVQVTTFLLGQPSAQAFYSRSLDSTWREMSWRHRMKSLTSWNFAPSHVSEKRTPGYQAAFRAFAQLAYSRRSDSGARPKTDIASKKYRKFSHQRINDFMLIAALVNIWIARVLLHTGPMEINYLNHGRPGCRPLFLQLQYRKLSCIQVSSGFICKSNQGLICKAEKSRKRRKSTGRFGLSV